MSRRPMLPPALGLVILAGALAAAVPAGLMRRMTAEGLTTGGA